MVSKVCWEETCFGNFIDVDLDGNRNSRFRDSCQEPSPLPNYCTKLTILFLFIASVMISMLELDIIVSRVFSPTVMRFSTIWMLVSYKGLP